MISKIRARHPLRNRRGYKRYSGTDDIGRSARGPRPASGPPCLTKNRTITKSAAHPSVLSVISSTLLGAADRVEEYQRNVRALVIT